MSLTAERLREEHAARSRAAPRPRASPGLGRVLQAAGNAATSRLLARDLPSLTGPIPFDAESFVRKQDADARDKILAYLESQRAVVLGHVSSGWSMAELVDMVRADVPEARTQAPSRIADILTGWSPFSIAAHRLPGDVKGAEAELLATVRNALSRIPTELKLTHHGAFVKLSVSGLEAGVEQGDDKLSVGSSGSDMAVNASLRHVSFGFKLAPGSGGDPTKWEIGLSFPGDDMVPLVASLGDVFSKANGSISSLAAGLRSGSVPSATSLKKQFEPVKDALDAVSAIADHSRLSLGVKVEGEGPAVSVTATVTVSF